MIDAINALADAFTKSKIECEILKTDMDVVNVIVAPDVFKLKAPDIILDAKVFVSELLESKQVILTKELNQHPFGDCK